MTVNHASTLKKEYFLGYLKLIMNARKCTLEQAKNLTLELFFHNNTDQYGDQTFQHFLDAYKELADINKEIH